MILKDIDPTSIDWDFVPDEKTNGAKGFAISKTKLFGEIKIRQIKYSAEYLADHWCVKGHILHVLEGELILDYEDGKSHKIAVGTTYIVGDNGTPHQARSVKGAFVLLTD